MSIVCVLHIISIICRIIVFLLLCFFKNKICIIIAGSLASVIDIFTSIFINDISFSVILILIGIVLLSALAIFFVVDEDTDLVGALSFALLLLTMISL